MVGVNTLIPNRLVAASIASDALSEFSSYDTLRREVKTPYASRIDLMLTKNEQERCYIEIKNCTLVEEGTAYFPDAKTARGLKHLVELQALTASGNRCVMFYLIQRMDARMFKPADHIDPEYGRELRRAAANGVEVMVYDVEIDLAHISLRRKVPYRL
jgi:sugar fermentation stimulation protein A